MSLIATADFKTHLQTELMINKNTMRSVPKWLMMQDFVLLDHRQS